MDLMESIKTQGNVRGITLNSLEVDLFNIIETAKSKEDAIEKVNEKLRELFLASKRRDLNRLPLERRVKKLVDENDNVDVKKKKEVSDFIIAHALEIKKCWDSKESLEKYFESCGKDASYVDVILDIKKYFIYQPQGILTFLVDKDGNAVDSRTSNGENIDAVKTYQKVEALYEYITGKLPNGENRFNELTLDSQGKFGTVVGFIDNENEADAKPEDYNLVPLTNGYEFALRHGMDVRVNTLVFYDDFPGRLVGASKETYQIALTNYGKAVASVVSDYEQKGVKTYVDMFNELVDYYEPFSERTDTWNSKLSIEELCSIATRIKRYMPNADFCYNDWNFENGMKRESICRVLDKIVEYEKAHPEEGKILDHIGMQFHTSINDIEGTKAAIEEMKKYGRPLYITELDISKGLNGIDYTGAIQKYKVGDTAELDAIRKYEQKLQNEMMRILRDAIQDGSIQGITAWSISDELCCDMAEGKEASIIGMSFEDGKFTYFGKDVDTVIEMTPEEMNLINKNRERYKQIKQNSINRSPVQDFSYHNHTSRCGHAQPKTSIEEYIEHAIKGGIKTIAFTDHMPIPGDFNKDPNSRMDMAEIDSYLDEIKFFRDKYAGIIDVQAGFEVEYSQREKMGAKNDGINHYKDLRRRCEEKGLPCKIVLGQHFVVDEKGVVTTVGRQKDGTQLSITALTRYSNDLMYAMQQGIPDIVAHPDIFMQGRNEFGNVEEFMTRMICKAARKTGTPLEINFGRMAQKYDPSKPISEQHIDYPSADFWKIVADETEIGAKMDPPEMLKVVFGKDSHAPAMLLETKDYMIAKEIIGEDTLSKLYFVKDDLRTQDTEMLKKLGIRKLDEGPSGVKKIMKENIKKIKTNPQDICPGDFWGFLLVIRSEPQGDQWAAFRRQNHPRHR